MIASRRAYCSSTVDHAGWVVTLHSPDEQDVSGKTLEEALAWCLVWLMTPELGTGSAAGTLPRTQSTVSRMALFYRLHVLLMHVKEP